MALQVSTVSKSLAEAAEMCLRPNMYLDLGHPGPPVPFTCLDSKLLLTWAQHFTHIGVDDAFLTAPGVPAFLGSASKLAEVSASCSTLVTAALADQLFSRRASITTLQLSGVHLPAVFPPALQKLAVNVADLDEDENHTPGAQQQLDLLVVRLNTWAGTLRCSDLDFGTRPILACQRQLPELQDLRVQFRVSQTPVDCQWLHMQPRKSLDITADIDRQDCSQQAQAAAELQKLQIDKLVLFITVPFEAHMQTVWHQVSSPTVTCLNLHTLSASPLYKLPGSPVLTSLPA